MKITGILFSSIAVAALIACISAVPENTNNATANTTAADYPAETAVTTTSGGYGDETTALSVPLSGTFSISFSVTDIDAGLVEGLDCELYQCETGEVIDSWNTSDEGNHTVSGLKYSFTARDGNYVSSITYKMRIKNLPENYVYYFGRTQEDTKVYAQFIGEFNKGSELNGKTMLVDIRNDATRTTFPAYTTTFTTAYDVSRVTTTAPSIPLSGTFDLNICFEFTAGRHGYVKDLECELYQCETGEVIDSWNTSDLKSPYRSIKGLEYNFVPTENGSYMGTITYRVRVKDLPEGYVLYPSGSRDIEAATFGNYLLKKTDFSHTFYIQDLNYSPSSVTTVLKASPTETKTTTAVPETPQTTTAPSIPLSGTYSLMLDFEYIMGRNGFVKGLDCELYQCETGEVVASWNTSDSIYQTIEGLEYNFVPTDTGNYKGTVTYKIRIKNLPESCVYEPTQGKEVTQVFGEYLAEFYHGTKRSFSVYIEDKDPPATTTTRINVYPQNTTATTAAQSTVNGDANLDGKTTVADAVAVLQHIGNRDKYALKPQGMVNADVDGEAGITAKDALTIQQWDAQGKL